MAAAVYELSRIRAFSYIQRPDTLWTVNFVSGNRKHIDWCGAYVYGDFPERLDRIAVENDTFFLRNLTYPGYIMDGAYLVIDVHYGDNKGFRSNCLVQLVTIDRAIRFNRQIGNFKPL